MKFHSFLTGFNDISLIFNDFHFNLFYLKNFHETQSIVNDLFMKFRRFKMNSND